MINRRNALAAASAGVAVAISSRGAFAQAAGPMGKDETQHMEQTMKVGSLALVTSRIAVKRAQNAQVKEFAEMEVAEQETIAEVLKSMKQPKAETMGQAPKPTDAEAMAMLDAKGKQMAQKLESASGAAFDKEFLAGQLDGHQDLLKIQESYISGGKNREHVNVAKLARGHIKDHIKIIQHLQKA